jgi:hypothetical protein
VISLIARNQRISTVIARGVSVLARCSADCSGIVKVTVTPAIARKLGLPVRKGANSVKLGSADLDLDGGTGQTVRIHLSRRAVDALDDATFRVPVTIEAVTDTMSTHISATLRP